MSNRSLMSYRNILAIFALLLLLAGCGGKGETMAVSDTKSGTGGKVMSWDSMPEMSIDLNKEYLARVVTDKGEFVISLDAEKKPVTVNNFVFLAREGFYDGLSFHSVIESYMIQTGDPKGNGTGDAGYRIPDELDADETYDIGTVAMFNTGSPNTGSSQFFICTGEEASNLNRQPNYAIFGKVTEGMDVVQAIASAPAKDGVPLGAIVIKEITIEEK